VSTSQVSVSGPGAGHAGMDAAQGSVHGRVWLVRPAQWTLWESPLKGVCYVLAVDLLGLATIVFSLLQAPVRREHVIWFTVLMACNILYTEASRSIERIREHYARYSYVDLNSVWMFGAVLLLHPALAAVVIATSYAYRWLRVRHRIVFRQTFAALGTITSGFVSSSFLLHAGGSSFPDLERTVGTFALVAATAVLFQVVSWTFIAVAIGLNTPNTRLRDVFISPGEHALEGATLALGILLAWALVDWPVALVLIIGITLVLHRNVLIRQLRDKARTDPKTGLLNAAGWSTTADSELTRAARAQLPCGLLVIDLDHFKAFNDSYGHLAGDSILRSVADTVSAEVRAYDVVGRFGGEEFVVLLPATNETETVHVAERIRARIAALPLPTPDDRLTVSIGVAVFPIHSKTLEELLHTADMAMYSAKASGRDRVHLASTNGTATNGTATTKGTNGAAIANGANAQSPHNRFQRSVHNAAPIPEPAPPTNGTRPTAVKPNAV